MVEAGSVVGTARVVVVARGRAVVAVVDGAAVLGVVALLVDVSGGAVVDSAGVAADVEVEGPAVTRREPPPPPRVATKATVATTSTAAAAATTARCRRMIGGTAPFPVTVDECDRADRQVLAGVGAKLIVIRVKPRLRRSWVSMARVLSSARFVS